MRILFALLTLTTTAMAQPVLPPPAAPQQLPPIQRQQTRPMIAPVPFGGLYNVLSGRQPPKPGQQAPLTPFNTATP